MSTKSTLTICKNKMMIVSGDSQCNGGHQNRSLPTYKLVNVKKISSDMASMPPCKAEGWKSTDRVTEYLALGRSLLLSAT